MQERLPVGFLFKQINTVYEKDINNQLKGIGITSSQCEVLDYLFHCDKEEVNQRDIEKALNLKNPTVTGLLQRLDEKGNAKDKRKKNVYLTEKAYDIQRRMEADRRRIDKNLTLGMTRREVQALQKMLNRVLYNVSDV